jgi:hypothetical protein
MVERLRRSRRLRNPVDDGIWHHAVLSAGTSSQTLTLDGVTQQTLNGATSFQFAPANLTFGAGYIGGNWPAVPNYAADIGRCRICGKRVLSGSTNDYWTWQVNDQPVHRSAAGHGFRGHSNREPGDGDSAFITAGTRSRRATARVQGTPTLSDAPL